MSTALATTVPNQYVAKKAMFSFLGNTFRLYDTAGRLQFYVKQKAFKLREEINVFADEGQTDKRLAIKARSISDFGGGYDVVDAQSGEHVGAAKRKGLKSLFRDEWAILGDDGSEVGRVVEVGGFLIFLRKFLKIIPQKYEVELAGTKVGSIHQQFNPFQLGYDVAFEDGKLDARLGVGLVVLLLAIEGGQDN